MAAEVLAREGLAVDLFDAMPSVGRKFLLAGRGGLNLTHSEPADRFLARYAERSEALRDAIAAFGADAVRQWAEGLGIATFVGTSGRVFPQDMKAAPLLRAWLHRLRAAGVRVHVRHRWTGWDAGTGELVFDTPNGPVRHAADATVLALGGASWPRLGSDGAWVPLLGARDVDIAPLQASNCGFDVAPTRPGANGWSDHLRQRFAGQPVKPVAARMPGQAPQESVQGEFVLTDTGIEGSLVYAFSARLRDAIAAHGQATWLIDLLPQHTADHVLAETRRPRGARSLSTHLKSRLGIEGLKMALLHELLSPQQLHDPEALASALKSLPLTLARCRPVEEAISTAGGVRLEALDANGMLRKVPGVFCAGEMLDWEAPTGGYLLTACFATGVVAGQGAARWLRQR
ncbi:TIGR03862 family flavoprotein [Ramlibacter sp. USB13]|uniref:TIGR03862 family flavoprotein n=2 Tax=Ramlibacter cellulosilyticus TaxID=2764187 RepID=A0A923MSW4_9BURK|nr:TIGR03862 family flavoprotein [Ramlibacter cellulosilyticus]